MLSAILFWPQCIERANSFDNSTEAAPWHISSHLISPHLQNMLQYHYILCTGKQKGQQPKLYLGNYGASKSPPITPNVCTNPHTHKGMTRHKSQCHIFNFNIIIQLQWKICFAAIQTPNIVITTKVCTGNGRYALIACAKFCSNPVSKKRITSKWIFHQSWGFVWKIICDMGFSSA